MASSNKLLNDLKRLFNKYSIKKVKLEEINMNLKLFVENDMLGRVEHIKYNNQVLMSRVQREKGVYSLINPKELYINGNLTFNKVKEVRKFIRKNRKKFYSLFNDVDIIPYKNIGLKISFKNESYIVNY